MKDYDGSAASAAKRARAGAIIKPQTGSEATHQQRTGEGTLSLCTRIAEPSRSTTGGATRSKLGPRTLSRWAAVESMTVTRLPIAALAGSLGPGPAKALIDFVAAPFRCTGLPGKWNGAGTTADNARARAERFEPRCAGSTKLFRASGFRLLAS